MVGDCSRQNTVADKTGMSRNDYLEALAEGSNPLMKTASSQA
jgi:hypothetical protein